MSYQRMNMYFKTYRMHISVATLVLAIIAFVAAYEFIRTPPLIQNGKVQYASAELYFYRLITTTGPRVAQFMYLREGKNISAANAHTLSHSFGQALYAALGIDGLRYCTADFVYGCYLQLIGTALLNYGTGDVAVLGDGCRKMGGVDVGGCLHGIGHGIVGYIGYSLKDLDNSLSVCDSLSSDNSSSAWCADGAFMEYNLHELTTIEGFVNARELTEKNTLTPCESISQRYRREYIFELATWWMAALPSQIPFEQRLLQMGLNCGLFQSLEDRRDCYEGVGYQVTLIVGYDASRVVAACNSASAVLSDRLFCLSGSARRYRTGHRSNYDTICATFGLSGTSRDYCDAEGRSGSLEVTDIEQFPKL